MPAQARPCGSSGAPLGSAQPVAAPPSHVPRFQQVANMVARSCEEEEGRRQSPRVRLHRRIPGRDVRVRNRHRVADSSPMTQAPPTGQSPVPPPVGSDRWEAGVVEAAREAGRSLTQSEADTGQVVWSWSRSDGTGPLFLTRRAALTWMAELLERNATHDR